MVSQKTLKREVTLSGIGLHSGKEARVTLRPARSGHGIAFVRKDLRGASPLAASFRNITSTQLATTLGPQATGISTVEHLMAAILGLGVDNLLVEVQGPEVPIMDGSSQPFVAAMMEAGIETQLQQRAVLSLRRRVEVKINEKWAVAEPSARLQVHASIDWDHPSIGFQEFHYIDGITAFGEIASARTFGFVKDVEALRRMGLARGGSLDNAVVLDDALVMNPEGLRFPDEFVRHKVLDALGDLALAGISMRAYLRLHRSGHDLHSQLLAEIFKNPDNYEILDPAAAEERRVVRAHAALAAAY
jgi:UDP-3-O-[3-hydroxymyristoyl] N-acetylglucosamine deacetylase